MNGFKFQNDSIESGSKEKEKNDLKSEIKNVTQKTESHLSIIFTLSEWIFLIHYNFYFCI